MAILAKTLMDIFYDAERKFRAKNDEELELENLEIADAYSSAESMVNNLMHGRPDAEWIPLFSKIMRERASESEPYLAEHFELIATLADSSLV